VSTIRWVLPDYLAKRGITAYRLARATSRRRENTIYRLARPGSQPASVDFEIIKEILDALRDITGEPVGLDDLISYSP
jgi:hypothetical protein